MNFDQNTVVAKFEDSPITLGDIFEFIRRTDNFQLFRGVAKEIVLKKIADTEGIKVDNSDLQKFFDEFRQERGLFTEAKTKKWIERNKSSIDDLDITFDSLLSKVKLKESVSDDAKIQDYFHKNEKGLVAVNIYQIVLADKKTATEVSTLIKTFDDFKKLASRYSIDISTKFRSGKLGTFYMDSLQKAIADAIKAIDLEKLPSILPPLEIDDLHFIFMIERFRDPQLDDEMRIMIKERLFDDWLSTRLKNTDFNFNL